MIKNLSKKKLLLLLSIFFLVLTIPFVIFLVKQRQTLESRASQAIECASDNNQPVKESCLNGVLVKEYAYESDNQCKVFLEPTNLKCNQDNIVPTVIPSIPITVNLAPNNTLLNLTVNFPNLLEGSTTSVAPQEKQVTVELYDTNNVRVYEASGILTPIATAFSGTPQTAKTYTGTINLDQNITTGVYTIKVKIQKYLVRKLPKSVNITARQTTEAPSVSLIAGDIDNNNQIDLADFNIWLACFEKTIQDTVNGVSCTNTDLNEDGQLDNSAVKSDYLILMKSFSSISGD